MKYYLCKRCGLVFSEEQIQAAEGKCPACFAGFNAEDLGGAWVECDKDCR